MGSPSLSRVIFVRRSINGRSASCRICRRSGRRIAAVHAACVAATPGSWRKWRSEYSSSVEFCTGVPLTTHRRSARSAYTARAVCVVCPLIT